MAATRLAETEETAVARSTTATTSSVVTAVTLPVETAA